MRVKDRKVAQLSFNNNKFRNDIMYIPNDDNSGVICLYRDGDKGKYVVEVIGDVTVIDVKGRVNEPQYKIWEYVKTKLARQSEARDVFHIEYLAKTLDIKYPEKYDIIKAVVDNLTIRSNDDLVDCLTGVLGDDWALGRGSIESDDSEN